MAEMDSIPIIIKRYQVKGITIVLPVSRYNHKEGNTINHHFITLPYPSDNTAVAKQPIA